MRWILCTALCTALCSAGGLPARYGRALLAPRKSCIPSAPSRPSLSSNSGTFLLECCDLLRTHSASPAPRAPGTSSHTRGGGGEESGGAVQVGAPASAQTAAPASSAHVDGVDQSEESVPLASLAWQHRRANKLWEMLVLHRREAFQRRGDSEAVKERVARALGDSVKMEKMLDTAASCEEAFSLHLQALIASPALVFSAPQGCIVVSASRGCFLRLGFRVCVASIACPALTA